MVEKSRGRKLFSTAPVFRQFVPGLPKTIEEAIKLGRLESNSKRTALHIFHTTKSCRSIISGYTDGWWKQLGHKAAHYKFKRLGTIFFENVVFVSVFHITNTDKEEAVIKHYEKTDIQGTPRSLSSHFTAKEKKDVKVSSM